MLFLLLLLLLLFLFFKVSILYLSLMKRPALWSGAWATSPAVNDGSSEQRIRTKSTSSVAHWRSVRSFLTFFVVSIVFSLCGIVSYLCWCGTLCDSFISVCLLTQWITQEVISVFLVTFCGVVGHDIWRKWLHLDGVNFKFSGPGTFITAMTVAILVTFVSRAHAGIIWSDASDINCRVMLLWLHFSGA